MGRVKIGTSALLLGALLVLAGRAAGVEDKKDDKPALAGVWRQSGGEMLIKFAEKDVLKLFPHGDNDVIVIVCSYTAGKEETVHAKIAALEGKAKDQVKDFLPVGLEFSFQWRAKDGAATIGNVKGDKAPDVLKNHLEGKYEERK